MPHAAENVVALKMGTSRTAKSRQKCKHLILPFWGEIGHIAHASVRLCAIWSTWVPFWMWAWVLEIALRAHQQKPYKCPGLSNIESLAANSFWAVKARSQKEMLRVYKSFCDCVVAAHAKDTFSSVCSTSEALQLGLSHSEHQKRWCTL